MSWNLDDETQKNGSLLVMDFQTKLVYIGADISVFIFHPSCRVCEGVKFFEKNQPGIEVILKKKFATQQ